MCNSKIRYERLFNPVEGDTEGEGEVETTEEEKQRVEVAEM